MPRTHRTAPLRFTTLKKYMKAQTDLRVSDEAAQKLAEAVNEQVERVADRAGALAAMQERTTVLWRDVQQALEEARQTGGDAGGQAGQSPEGVFLALEGFDIEQLGELARRLEASLKD